MIFLSHIKLSKFLKFDLVYMDKMFLAEQKYRNPLHELCRRIYVVVKKKLSDSFETTTIVVFLFYKRINIMCKF